MARYFLISVMSLVIGMILACTKIGPPESSIPGSTAQMQTASSQLVATVSRVLEKSGRSGSLVYEGQCTDSGAFIESFTIAPAVYGVSPVKALRQAFIDDPSLQVREDSSGLIRVVGGDVETGLLRVTIHNIEFREEDDPRDATYKVLASPEVTAYMQAHRMTFVTTSGGIFPLPSRRHLTAKLNDVTVSQALDRVVQSFPGIWIYKECMTGEGKRRVEITFQEFSAPLASARGKE